MGRGQWHLWIMPEVRGLDELLKKLDLLPYAVSKLVVARALRKGAEPIRAEAEHEAPRLSGRLQREEVIAVGEQTATEAIAKIGPSRKAFYGLFQEFGTAHQTPQKFLEPAFESKVSEATDVIGKELAAGIEKAMR